MNIYFVKYIFNGVGRSTLVVIYFLTLQTFRLELNRDF
jgi:hypothetical protein